MKNQKNNLKRFLSNDLSYMPIDEKIQNFQPKI